MHFIKKFHPLILTLFNSLLWLWDETEWIFLKSESDTFILNTMNEAKKQQWNIIIVSCCSQLSTFLQVNKLKGTLFLTPLPPSPKCTTKNVDFIVKTLYSQKTFMKVSTSFIVICSCNKLDFFFTKCSSWNVQSAFIKSKKVYIAIYPLPLLRFVCLWKCW